MIVPPSTRRANRWLLAGLIVFAIGLCALVLVWMRITVRDKGGIVDPQVERSARSVPVPFVALCLPLEFSADPI